MHATLTRPAVLLVALTLTLFTTLADRPVAGTGTQGTMNTLTAAEQAAGWRLLFDGKTTAGWRAYGAGTMPAGWQVVDGVLTRVSAAADIITKEQFGDFELTLEWAEREETAGSSIARWKDWSGSTTAPLNTRFSTTPGIATGEAS